MYKKQIVRLSLLWINRRFKAMIKKKFELTWKVVTDLELLGLASEEFVIVELGVKRLASGGTVELL